MTASRHIYATSTGVWSTDGTSAGTTLLKAAGTDFVPQPGAQMVTLPNGKVLFFALVNGMADPVNGAVDGIQVWETDGTVSGTTMTGSTYSPDDDQSAGDTISNVVAIGGEVSFVFNQVGGEPVLLATDGTSAGTAPETTTLPQTGLPSTGAVTGGSTAHKYIYATSTGVWSTDGTSAGTTLLKAAGTDFVPQPSAQLVTLPNGKVLFFALVNGVADPLNGALDGIQIWESDGTVSGTTMTGSTYSQDDDETAGDTISNVVAIRGEVSFVFNQVGSEPVLFATDGTSAGTAQETTTLPQTGLPSTGAVTGGSTAHKYIYATSTGVWSTDGTSAGTTLLKAAGTDFVPQPSAQLVTLPNGKVLFFALVNGLADPTNGALDGIQIWETDGTVSGTTMTGSTYSPDDDETAGDTISNVVAIRGEVSFVFNQVGSEPLLFATDGTSAGTAQETTTLPRTGLVGTGAETACYCRGTRVLTESGDIAVERLKIGDRVVTVDGSARPVRWIGYRSLDLTGHPAPDRARPIVLHAHAVADGVPCRDLRVSPDHALLFDGMLNLARHLVNGASIQHDLWCSAVTYYHVELETHDILLAEGMPAESYLDTGNRGMFENAEAPLILHPDFKDDQQQRVARSCRPLVDAAAAVEPIWRRLAARASFLGLLLPEAVATTSDPAPRLVIGGRAIKPIRADGGRYTFVLPRADGPVRLVSRVVRPCDSRPWVEDRRRLGVAVSRLVLRHGPHAEPIPLDHALISRGWWDVERDHASLWRWTDGDAVIPLPDARPAVLEITLSGGLAYPVDREAGADVGNPRWVSSAHPDATDVRRHFAA